MKHPLSLPINSLLPELISVGFLSPAPKGHIGRISHPDSWPAPQLNDPSCVFCLKSSICPLFSGMPLSHKLLYAAPRCSRILEDITPCGPKFTTAFFFPAATSLLSLCQWNSVSSSHPVPLPTPPLYGCLGILADDGTTLAALPPPPSRTVNSPCPPNPQILISILSSSLFFPLLALEPNSWATENYLLFFKT